MFLIFESFKPKKLLSSTTLFENKTYYIEFDSPNDDFIIAQMESEPLASCISWHPGNKVADLVVRNRIGLLRIFDTDYEVRSEKFDKSLTGPEQIKNILDELDEISRKISFSYSSSVHLKAHTDWHNIEHDLIYKFNYLYQIFFEVKPWEQVASLLDDIVNNPALKYDHINNKKHLWEIKSFTPSTITNLARNDYKHKQVNSAVANERISIPTHFLSNNTPENQFIRFFLEYSSQISLQVSILTTKKIQSDKKSGRQAGRTEKQLAYKSERIIKECRLALSLPFFKEVSSIPSINSSSTILRERPGYSDIHRYYIASNFSIKHVYESFKSSFKSDLMEIATLYEIWCFYKVSYRILGKNITVTQSESQVRNGKVTNSTTFKNMIFEVSYNKTFSISNSGSYSTELRPDITIKDIASSKLFHFDAKYKIKNKSNGEESKAYKPEDINKMHAYLDAIYSSESAVVLYPGKQFSYFESTTPPALRRNPSEVTKLNGVGALPLSPGKSNDEFDLIMGRFFKSC